MVAVTARRADVMVGMGPRAVEVRINGKGRRGESMS